MAYLFTRSCIVIDITPDLLTHEDGTAVTRESWDRRRSELREAIVEHEYGGLPPSPLGVEGMLRCKAALRYEGGIGFQTWEVGCSLPCGGTISFDLQLWIPHGDGPFPVVLDGDGCWRYFTDDIVRQVIDSGSIAASFDRTALAADNQERYRESGLYRFYPDATFGALSAWAWGYHRCIDLLETLEVVDQSRIAITGHSRGGKTVLLAGATDERIAVTNPNDSGAGGSGLNHFKCENAEVVADFFRSGAIFWFGPGYGEYRDRDSELPYDQHFLHALVAPRGLLVHEAHGDVWANPPGSYAACRAAEPVYALLGAKDAIGWSFREGGHGHTPADFASLLDFLEPRFHGRETVRGFKREVYCNLAGEFV